MRVYASYEKALARVEVLKARPFLGAWPGIIGPDADGWYRLTFDPPDLPNGL